MKIDFSIETFDWFDFFFFFEWDPLALKEIESKLSQAINIIVLVHSFVIVRTFQKNCC